MCSNSRCLGWTQKRTRKHRSHISHFLCVPTPMSWLNAEAWLNKNEKISDISLVLCSNSQCRGWTQKRHKNIDPILVTWRCVPTPNVLVKRDEENIQPYRHFSWCSNSQCQSVERRSGIKHIFHISHFFLCSNSQCLGWTQKLNKTYVHISHFFCVPIPNVLVERRSDTKHRSHISHFFLYSNSQCLGWTQKEWNIRYISVTFSVFQPQQCLGWTKEENIEDISVKPVPYSNFQCSGWTQKRRDHETYIPYLVTCAVFQPHRSAWTQKQN